MTSWEDYKAVARDRGALAFEVYAAESMPIEGAEPPGDTLPRHLGYQRELEESGQLAFAGPLSDETGETMSGGGLIVYRAASLDEARALAEADPMHREGKRSYVLRRWLINEASLKSLLGP